jgi:hypothetical protein
MIGYFEIRRFERRKYTPKAKALDSKKHENLWFNTYFCISGDFNSQADKFIRHKRNFY